MSSGDQQHHDHHHHDLRLTLPDQRRLWLLDQRPPDGHLQAARRPPRNTTSQLGLWGNYYNLYLLPDFFLYHRFNYKDGRNKCAPTLLLLLAHHSIIMSMTFAQAHIA